MTSNLSSQEMQTFAEDGLVKPDCRLPEQTMQRMRSLADSTLAATKAAPTDNTLSVFMYSFLPNLKPGLHRLSRNVH